MRLLINDVLEVFIEIMHEFFYLHNNLHMQVIARHVACLHFLMEI